MKNILHRLFNNDKNFRHLCYIENSMERRKANMFLLVIVVLLLQVVLPVFAKSSDSIQESSPNTSVLHAEVHSLIPPALMKEKDETENESDHLVAHLFQIIDFSNHSSFLSEFHTSKLASFLFDCHNPVALPLFTLNSVYLI